HVGGFIESLCFDKKGHTLANLRLVSRLGSLACFRRELPGPYQPITTTAFSERAKSCDLLLDGDQKRSIAETTTGFKLSKKPTSLSRFIATAY
ncbi:MAG: hypothetical protein VB857_03515, partial [Pirellulaceae bacterium]